MGKWTSTTGNTVTILPWTDEGYKFITLDCEEVLGGRVASGTIEMVHDGNDKALEMLNTENTVTIELGTTENGVLMTIKGVIISRELSQNCLTINFSCLPDINFWTRRGTLISEDIDSAISGIWKGETDIRTATDLPSGIVYNQASDYDYQFLQNLCESYKKDTVYAFGLEGLLIKDLIGIDSSGNQEPYWDFLGNEHAIQEQGKTGGGGFSLNYDPKLYMKPEDSWENSDTQSEYWGVRTFNEKYRLIHKDYQILRENQFNNKRIYKSRMYNQIHLKHTNFFQLYRLGDVVKYHRAYETDDYPWSTYIISRIVYHYRTEASPNQSSSGDFPFFIEYTLHCLEENGNIMSDQDPMEE